MDPDAFATLPGRQDVDQASLGVGLYYVLRLRLSLPVAALQQARGPCGDNQPMTASYAARATLGATLRATRTSPLLAWPCNPPS